MPNQRPNPPPLQIENAAMICSTPRMSVTQPQVLSSLRMYFWFATKKLALSMAAIP